MPVSLERSKELLLYVFAIGFSRCAPLLLMPIFLVTFSTEEYGQYIIVFIIAKILARFFNLSGTTALLRECEDKALVDCLYKNYTVIACFAAIVSSAVLGIVNLSVGFPSLYLLLPLFALSEAVFNLKIHQLRAHDRHNWFLAYNFLKFFIELTVLATTYFMNLSAVKFVVAYSLFTLAFCITTNLKGKVAPLEIIRKYKYTLPIIPTTVLGWLLNSSDRIVIKYFWEEQSVVEYSVGYNLASIGLLLTGALAIWLPPKLFSHFEAMTTPQAMKSYFLKYSGASIGLVLIATLAFCLDKQFFNLFKFHSGEVFSVLVLSSLGCFFTGLVAFTSNVLVYFKDTNTVLKIDIAAAATNIILNILLIPKFGILGAAATTLFSFMLQFLLSGYFCRRHLYQNGNTTLG